MTFKNPLLPPIGNYACPGGPACHCANCTKHYNLDDQKTRGQTPGPVMRFLVINSNKGSSLLLYRDRYRLFTDFDAAVAAAKELGFCSPWGFGISDKVGVASRYECGPVNVTILPLEDQP